VSEDGRFRRWLRTTPHPVKLRLDLAGSRPPVVLALSRTNANRFAEAEKSVRAMGEQVLTVEALDVHEVVLRVFRLRDEEDEPAPAQKEPWPQSPDAQMAQVITASNDRAASRHEAAYKLAFDKLEAMYQGLLTLYNNEVRRTAQLEAALQRELARKEVALPESEDGIDGLINQLLPVIMPRLLAAGGDERPNGANSAKEK
jgi:hypothetical protein